MCQSIEYPQREAEHRGDPALTNLGDMDSPVICFGQDISRGGEAIASPVSGPPVLKLHVASIFGLK
jgi:NRPS condensation-like uncharacterized protein